MFYNNKKYVSDFKEKLYDYWEELMNQYNSRISLIICDTIDYIRYNLESQFFTESLSRDEIINMMGEFKSCNNNRTGATTCTLFTLSGSGTDTIISELGLVVIIRYDDLYINILENIGNLDQLYEYYKIVLRHEMGHVLDITDIFQLESGDEILKMLRHNSDDIESISELLTKDIDPIETLRMCNNVPIEKRANDRVGLTVDDFMKYQNFLDSIYDFSIKIK